jgi:hypothetical protein
VRALDAEEQLRPIDALVLGDQRAAFLVRLAPEALRGAAPPIGRGTAAVDAVAALREVPLRQDPA